MKKILIVTLGALALGSGAFAENKNPVKTIKKAQKQEHVVNTFEEALIYAFNNNQSWFSDKADKQIAKIRKRQAGMAFLPSLEGKFGMTRSAGENVTDSSTGHDKGDRYETSQSMSLNLKMNIFEGLRTLNTYKMRSNEDKSAFHTLKGKSAKLIVDVLDAYADVWKCRQTVAARRKMEENLEKTWKSQQTKLESGISTPAEVAGAKANYQSSVHDRILSETELLSAEAKFEKLTGAVLGEKAKLPDIKVNIPKDLDQLIAVCMRANHDILGTRFAEKAAFDALAVARGKLAPSVDASLQWGKNISDIDAKNFGTNTNNRHDNTHTNNQYIGKLEVTVPLFANSGSDYSEISIAEETAKKAQYKAKDTVLSVREQCVVNWNTFIATDAMITASRVSIESAQLSSESYQEESELGIKSNTEVWDQENKLQQSKINFADSKKKKLLAAINISYLMGELTLSQFLRLSEKKTAKKVK